MASKRSRGAKKAWTASRDKKVAKAREKKKERKATLFWGRTPFRRQRKFSNRSRICIRTRIVPQLRKPRYPHTIPSLASNSTAGYFCVNHQVRASRFEPSCVVVLVVVRTMLYTHKYDWNSPWIVTDIKKRKREINLPYNQGSVFLVSSTLLEAFSAVDWLALGRLEWNFTFLLALSASSLVHSSGGAIVTSFITHAILHFPF